MIIKSDSQMVLAFDLNQNSCPCVLITGITKAIMLSETMKGLLWDQEGVSLSVRAVILVSCP